ncbi:MAG: hypothetical protein IPP15_05390 [Saprospiraceae bacterium]|uniref:Uncharacterized protein n=1 Tax=Candidatus Opimibacter skivensis TaxID=2982028 RepID=A0A9D7XM50_9BACT|nr:hypothetical protein [Candidatus Opimibacter skivensis]
MPIPCTMVAPEKMRNKSNAKRYFMVKKKNIRQQIKPESHRGTTSGGTTSRATTSRATMV